MSRLFFSLFLLFSFYVLSVDNVVAQEKSKKELRKEKRENQISSMQTVMLNKINKRDFEFIATEIVSTGISGVSNIKLNSIWDVNVTPDKFSCFLPIYGAVSPMSQPGLREKLNIFNADYKMEVGFKNKRINVKIKTKDNASYRNYYFNFSVSSDGRMSTLTVSSDFKSPVTFRGDIK